MPNSYCNLVATNLIKDEYTKITDGFGLVEADIDAHAADTTPHDAATNFVKVDGSLDMTGSLKSVSTTPKFTAASNSFAASGDGTGFVIHRQYSLRLEGNTWEIVNAIANGGAGPTDFQTDHLIFKVRKQATDVTLTEVIRFQVDGIIKFENGTTHGEVTGSPEGAVTAVVGSTRYRTDGGASTTLYVKESGVGNTGWVAK